MSKEKQLDIITDLLIDFDEMGFAPTTLVPDPEGYAIEWKKQLTNALEDYFKQSENVIELPCKIGDVVYIIDDSEEDYGEPYVLGVRVLQFFINENGIALDLQMPLGLRLNTWAAIGKNVFLTREEAEAKMKGGEE